MVDDQTVYRLKRGLEVLKDTILPLVLAIHFLVPENVTNRIVLNIAGASVHMTGA
jgi:hypothetical protein